MAIYFPKMTAIFSLVSALIFLHPAIGNALDLRTEIDPHVEQLLSEEKVVGLVVGIYKDGETQVIGYGEIEKGSGIAPNGETVYEIGSASKAFTGVLLADLVLRGKANLDDPLPDYVPRSSKPYTEGLAKITLEHLATHTSGLPRLPENFQPADPQNPYADYTLGLLYDFLKEHKLRRAPGQYEYSNYGMGLLGVLLARHEKMSYEKLLITRIAKPCGMHDTSVKLSSGQLQRLAPPYSADLKEARNWDIPVLAGAGGIRSTANDMLQFVAANLEAGHPLADACRLSHEQRPTTPGEQAVGLAWHIAGDGITRWHNGMTGGYASWLSVIPDHNIGVVVLSNTAADEITPLGENITRITFGQKVAPVAASPAGERSPFTGVRWKESVPEVKLGQEWFKLVSLDGVSVDEIVAFSKQTYGDRWQKRFAEDLVALLTGMGHPPRDTVALVVQSLSSSETKTLPEVAMTRANRQTIRESAQEAAVDVAPDVLQSYEGVYAITPQFALTVTVEDGKLMVQATGQQKYQVYPESETKFFYKVVDAQLTFVIGKSGKAEVLILHQNGLNQAATRQE